MPKPNLLLDSLSPGDSAALHPHLKPIYLDQQKLLFDAGEPIDAVYFPTGAIVSLVVGLSTGEMVEAAMVGRDGVVGAAAAAQAVVLSMEVALLGARGRPFISRRAGAVKSLSESRCQISSNGVLPIAA